MKAQIIQLPVRKPEPRHVPMTWAERAFWFMAWAAFGLYLLFAQIIYPGMLR